MALPVRRERRLCRSLLRVSQHRAVIFRVHYCRSCSRFAHRRFKLHRPNIRNEEVAIRSLRKWKRQVLLNYDLTITDSVACLIIFRGYALVAPWHNTCRCRGFSVICTQRRRVLLAAKCAFLLALYKKNAY